MTISEKALQKLLTRRIAIQAAIDDAAVKPASYSIQGSVSATAQKLADLRAELAQTDRDIEALTIGPTKTITRSYPDYR